MKKKLLFAILSLVLIPVIKSNKTLYGQDTTVTISFMGSAGYFIESPGKKVLIDALFGDIVLEFGSAYPPEEEKTKLMEATDPYDSVDLLLYSHVHLGHMEARSVATSLQNNTKAILVTTQEVYNMLSDSAENFAEIQSRIYVPVLTNYEIFDTVISEIPIAISKSEHWGPTELHTLWFNLEGMVICYYLDYDPSRNAGTHYVNTDDIDIAFLDIKLLMENYSLLTEFDAKHVYFTHLSEIASNKTGWETEITNQSMTNAHLITEAMEQITFSKQNDSVFVGPIVHTDLSPKATQNVLDVYPNPTDGTITITLNNKSLMTDHLLIYNAEGKLVKRVRTNEQNIITIDLNHLASGTYMIAFNETIQEQRIIIK